MREIVVTKNEDNQRLDKFLEKYLPKAPKSLLQKFLRQKRIKLNKKRAYPNSIIYKDDIINIYIYEEDLIQWEKEKEIFSNIDLDIAYEDEDIIIFEKPKGILSHPSSNDNKGDTVVDFLLYYLNKKNEYLPNKEKTFTPSIINRLDMNTEGLIIGVKNRKSQVYLNNIISTDLIEKNYLAIVHGNIKNKMFIEDRILKNKYSNKVNIDDSGKESQTLVMPLESSNNFTLVKIRILTGRSHQIRIHLSNLGYPIVGDLKYGNMNLDKKYKTYKDSQYLIAHEFIFSNKIKMDQLKGKRINHSKTNMMYSIFNTLVEE